MNSQGSHLDSCTPSIPMLKPGEPMQLVRRVLGTTEMIHSGRKLSAESIEMSPLRRKKSAGVLTPTSSASDLLKLLHPAVHECSAEELLREWDDLDVVAQAATDDDRAAIGQLLDHAEVLALKRAEGMGWFLHGPSWCDRVPHSRLQDIRRGNVEEWAAWAFYHRRPADMPASRREELDEVVDEIGEFMEVELRPGHNHEFRAMRLTMDPIVSTPRPLLYYTVTHWAFSIVIDVQFWRSGFTKHKSGTITYWLRPGSSTKAPIVFCHGLGVNLLPYKPLIDEILECDPERCVFLISLPHISMRLIEDVPSSSEVVACLSEMLASWGFTSAHWIGHSFGSLVLAWMCKKAPDYVSMLTFLDPVCFMLFKPDVCYNFIYRRPTTATQLLTQYFVSQELYIAHSLCRNFFWLQNLLWPEEMPAPCLCVLCGNDSIVPAHSIRRYLAAYKRLNPKEDLQVLWFPNMGHGEINFGPIGLNATQRIVSEMLALETKLLYPIPPTQ